ncbi:unnamed protein product [Kluyveromyces dobzhanskii CBS 2104]|uniref:WGS project CCBQ000000000 data, contig 00028 n=1 Tax=Kluyveromyces dobzhanskii CBS 2104 TaxID=1427455 RepID=A0A0A8KYS0_9SACH|nr:unnamed protein product [Kluyveromyces dobzhanskii CBS 2104]
MSNQPNISRVELGIHYGTSFTIITEHCDKTVKSYKLEGKKVENERTAPNQKLGFSGELLVVDSVFSGSGRDQDHDFASNVVAQFFDQTDISYRLIKTASKSSVVELATSLEQAKDYIVLFLSGDTSISEFINSLPAAHANISILPFPMGTGNAWASSLNLSDPATIFSQFIRQELSYHDFPLYRATFDNGQSIKFFIILSLGFHANLLHLCEEEVYQQMGVERFRIASQRILEDYELQCHISISETLHGSYSYFALINTTHLEPTYLPSPDSDPLKSQLHVLAYESSLEKSDFQKKLMKGYQNSRHSDISGIGTVYTPLPSSFVVKVSDDPSQKQKFEICCDGQLLNLLELNETHNIPSSIQIETCTEPSLKILHSLK